MSDFEEEIRRRAEALRSAKQAERDRWLEQRRAERKHLKTFSNDLAYLFKTDLIRFDVDEIEEDDEFEFDDEIKIILVETNYHFGTIEIDQGVYRFEPTSWHHDELKSVQTTSQEEFLAKFRETLLDYLAAVEAEEEDE